MQQYKLNAIFAGEKIKSLKKGDVDYFIGLF